MTPLDETPQDIALNPTGSFAISEIQISGDPTCAKTDAEDPTCSRVSFTGEYTDLTAEGRAEEGAFALAAITSKHPEMVEWGKPATGSHGFHLFKLTIKTIFFLGDYGGSTPVSAAALCSLLQ